MAQDHTRKWQSWNRNPGTLHSKPPVLQYIPMLVKRHPYWHFRLKTLHPQGAVQLQGQTLHTGYRLRAAPNPQWATLYIQMLTEHPWVIRFQALILILFTLIFL